MEEMSLEQGLEEIGHKILVLTRNELYMKMRFMDVALSAFYYVQDFSVDLLATDGETMYFNGQMLGGEYRQNRIEVNRAYLHLVLHCIFRHVFRRNGREGNQGIYSGKNLWSTGKMEAFGQRDGAHDPGIYRG